jgi:hypothetical protein
MPIPPKYHEGHGADKWAAYKEGDYYIQTQTRNTSFVKMYKYLKKIGVRNNKFFLKLYDPDLMDVNPHSSRLTEIQKKKIIAEVTRNPWYYLREVCLIPAPGAAIRFELHRGNLAALWSLFNNFNFFLLLPRQKGKTMSVAAGLTWIYHFGTTNTQMLFSNKAVSDAVNNLKRFKDITLLLPEYIQSGILDFTDTNNVESIVGAKRNNSIVTKGSANSTETADKMGRGMSVPILWYDEFAFLKHSETIYSAAAPAQSKVAEVARANGKPYCKVITTTPNNIDSDEGSYAHGMIQNACAFLEQMYDWTHSEVEKFIEDNSMNDFLYIKFTWQQLGLTEEWYRKECRNLNNNTLIIRREIDLVWTKSTDNSVLNEDTMEIIDSHLISEPISTREFSIRKRTASDENGANFTKFLLRIYRPMDPKKPYLTTVDTAGGTGRDNSVVMFIDPDDLKPVAILKSNKINVPHFAELLCELAEAFPNCFFIPERNSYGLALIDILLRKIPKRVFYDYKIPEKDKASKNPKSKNIVYGVNTDTGTRDAMVDLFLKTAEERPEALAFGELFDEVKTLIYNKKGKMEHDNNCHDDVVMSYLFGLYVVEYSTTIWKFVKQADRDLEQNAKMIRNPLAKTDPSRLNDVDHPSRAIASLTLEELIEIRTRGITPEQFLAEKSGTRLDGKKSSGVNQGIAKLLHRKR